MLVLLVQESGRGNPGPVGCPLGRLKPAPETWLIQQELGPNASIPNKARIQLEVTGHRVSGLAVQDVRSGHRPFPCRRALGSSAPMVAMLTTTHRLMQTM